MHETIKFYVTVRFALSDGLLRYGTIGYGMVRYGTIGYGTVRYKIRIKTDSLLYQVEKVVKYLHAFSSEKINFLINYNPAHITITFESLVTLKFV